MATSTYLTGRQRYGRPQGVIWSNNSGILSGGIIVPDGVEGSDFIVLSDHGRSEISFNKERIENRKRMINGGMRSYHIADKVNITWSWDMIPSRAFNTSPSFNVSGKATTASEEYTADGGAGGVDLIKWYEDHPGPFYMFLAYDRFDKFDSLQYTHLGQYNEVLNVYFASFDYNVVRRGSTSTHDFFDIDVSLEEV